LSEGKIVIVAIVIATVALTVTLAFLAIASAIVIAGLAVIVIVIGTAVSYAKLIGFGRSTGQPNTFQNNKIVRS